MHRQREEVRTWCKLQIVRDEVTDRQSSHATPASVAPARPPYASNLNSCRNRRSLNKSACKRRIVMKRQWALEMHRVVMKRH